MHMIFHHPLPIDRDGWSASAIRPRKMVEAFERLGYSVDLVTGYSGERRESIRRIKEHARKGRQYRFLYSESSTMPTLLTDPHHLPLTPMLDFGLFNWCKGARIPVGLFYRDIHWMFPHYESTTSALKARVAAAFYRYDLARYRKRLDVLFLPSLEMSRYLPGLDRIRRLALPPAHQESATLVPANNTVGRLSLLYVGGVSDLYRLDALIEAVREVPSVELTICTRSAEWEACGNRYPALPSHIKVVHEHGEGLKSLYESADIGMLFVEPHEYWAFAAPMKLYEYVGHGKPIIASEGTRAGRFVTENGAGWTVPYAADALSSLLGKLAAAPDRVSSVSSVVAKIAPHHSWRARAETAAAALVAT